MQVTIDDETLHKWARDAGYVRLTDISEFVAQKLLGSEAAGQLRSWPDDPLVSATEAFDTLAAEAAEFEQLDDLKPVPTIDEATDALRRVMDLKGEAIALQLRDDFGFVHISALPEADRAKFIAAAERLVA